MSLPAWTDLASRLSLADPIRSLGKVTRLVGMVIEVEGLVGPIGSVVRIEIGRNVEPVLGEVVGFRDNTLLVMPYTDSDGLAPSCKASLVSGALTVPTGPELLGRVIDGLGRPLDGGPPLTKLPQVRLNGRPPHAMTRRRNTEILSTGIRSIDSMITTARGQRLGIFAGSGVGKSVLMGMLARQAEVEINVLALIGERGREVREFIERDLGPEGLARSVVVVVTSDESAVMRAKGAETAMSIAESYRASNHEVLFMMDSATRYAMALREIGLAAGEPPTTKGYPPSVFAALPKLCERAGCSDINAMTAFFTVLIEGDDIHDPVGDSIRSILDGHIMLSRDLARQHHYPAVDVLGSVSRLRNDIVTDADKKAGAQLMRWMKSLEDNKDLVSIGAYVKGADPLLDEALANEEKVREFLTQGITESTEVSATLEQLRELTGVA